MRRTHLTLLAFAAAWIVPAVALAIGPQDQKIADDPNPLSLRAIGILTTQSGSGTGTVVAAKVVGTTGYVAILTAHHVAASQPMALKLGSLIGGAQPWMEFATIRPFRKYHYNDPLRNPNRLPADVAMMLGKVENLTEGSQALTRFNQLRNNLPTIVNPGQGAGNPLVAAREGNPVGFTQLGYGRLAEYRDNLLFIDDSTTVRQRYQATGMSGKRLFQNNQANAYVAPALVRDPITNQNTYYHPLVRFNAIGPPNNLGQGVGMGGDSGGPLFTRPPTTQITVPVTRGGNNLQIPIDYTDSLSAVFVASTPVVVTEIIDGVPFRVPYDPEVVPIGAEQLAVPINGRLYRWMQPALANPCVIPEPATISLLAWLAVAVFRRGNRGRNSGMF